MSAAVTNQPAKTESKSAKKKRAKGEAPPTLVGPSTATSDGTPTPAEDAPNGTASDGQENAVMKELQKNLRNAVKKLNATAKADSIVAENPGKSFDDLVAEKKINPDQKAQLLKKPSLQARVTQLEEQIAQFKQFSAQYEERIANQKAALEKLENTHKEELENEKRKAAEATESAKKDFKNQLLVLSRFLRAATALRHAGVTNTDESDAFEGALVQIYGGTEEAVFSMLKLINGSEEKLTSATSEPLDVTYLRVKQASLEFIPTPDGVWTEGNAEPTNTAEYLNSTDPTVANASLTELQEPPVDVQATPTNGISATETQQQDEGVQPPSQSVVSPGAANAVAESNWDGQASSTTAEGWVEVERNPTEANANSAPAPTQNPSSWAEDVPTSTQTTSNEEAGDGFEQVTHHSRQNSGRGRGFRGRGPRGDFRGDFRGGRGIIRGHFRGRTRGRGGNDFRGDFRGGRGRGGHFREGQPPTGAF